MVEKLYTLQECANICKCTRRTLYNYVKQGKINATKPFNDEWRVSESELQRFVEGKR